MHSLSQAAFVGACAPSVRRDATALLPLLQALSPAAAAEPANRLMAWLTPMTEFLSQHRFERLEDQAIMLELLFNAYKTPEDCERDADLIRLLRHAERAAPARLEDVVTLFIGRMDLCR